MNKFPIKKEKMELKLDERFYPKCAICGKRIEKGEEVVYVPTSSWYSNWKSYFVAHEECFLKELYKVFEGKISMKKKTRKRILLKELE